MSTEPLVPFSETVKSLQKLCEQGETGTMFILTDKEEGASLSLLKGKIVDISYRALKGMRAVPFLQKITSARHIFKPNAGIKPAAYELPESQEILKRIQGKHKHKKILVVEDSSLARKAVIEILSIKGYDYAEAKDGFEALGKLSEDIPDLVLLDLVLPKMDGYAVLTAMKKDDAYKHIPVIVLTSRDALFDKLKGKMSGTDEYLTKPIQPNELLNKLNKYLAT